LRSARASARQADLDLLWAEWGAAQQARQLALTILADEAKALILQEIAAELADRATLSGEALTRGDVTLATVGADMAAKLDAVSQLDTARHDAAKARGDLNALIGLAPDARLDLVPGASPRPLDAAALDGALTSLPDRRPDLLALRAGAEAQDANVRTAIQSRFPLINLGFSHQRDNSAIVSNGLAATFVIPIFNRGRGEVAVRKATREALATERQARLDQTVADVAAARRDRDTARDTLARLEQQVPAFVGAADRARAAAGRRDIDGATFLALDQAALKERLAILDQRLAVALADLSLETVLFLPSDESSAP
jgi:outer membrane protein TolC